MDILWLTARAPPQVVARVGVSTSMYYCSWSCLLKLPIILDLFFRIYIDVWLLIRSRHLLRYLVY